MRTSDDRAIAQTPTDRAGAFRFESVPPGNYTFNSETVAIIEKALN